MSTQKRTFNQLQETLFYEQLDNGLDVYVLPKPGFHKTYATFTTKYGSIDNHFITPDGREEKVVDGIAHFLEHKMFEEEEGDIFHEFSRYGASANAFTSFDRTAYLFSCTDHIEQNLTTLLNFVQKPYFTDENVEKEKGIIEQEIRMYQDNPEWRLYFGLINSLYHHHPVQIDIAGTVESIYQIDKEMLYTCYETFYHPSNMVLFVVGPVQKNDILSLVRDNQQAKSFPNQTKDIERIFPKESDSVSQAKQEISLSLAVPKCMMGFKETRLGLQGTALLQQELATRIILDLLLGSGSTFYQQLIEEGLIDDSFGTEYNLEMSYGYSLIGGNSKDPDRLVSKIKEYIAEALTSGIDAGDFERIKKKVIGSFLKAFNSPEFIANQFTRYQFNEMDLFDVIPTLENIERSMVEQRMQDHFVPERLAVCIVK